MNKSTKYLLAFAPSVAVVIAVGLLNPAWFAGDGWWTRAGLMLLGLGTISAVALRMLDPEDRL